MDGTVLDGADARVSVFDRGFTVGDGVFETLVVHDGRPFALGRHLARFHASARGLDLEVPVGDDELRRAVAAVVAAGRGAVGRVRLTLTGGPAPSGGARRGPPTLVVTGEPASPWPATARVATVPWPRNERSPTAGLKTTSYADNGCALRAAHARGADEALVPNTVGMLCEGTSSNVFVVLGGRLVTPPLSAGCLPGVTRALVLEVTGAEEADVPMAALAEVAEAFLTSTTRGVQPVARLDDRALPAPGPLTAAARAAFEELVRTTIDP
ncbi:MAG: aminotransferase class IV [Acidimicrobiia bacterium]